MAKKRGARILVTLECTECRERNYITEKSRRNTPARMELTKFCSRCRKHRCTGRRSNRLSLGE